MAVQREIIHTGHDNTIDRRLKADGVVVNLSAVTKMTLTIGALTISSLTTPSSFDWSSHAASGIVHFKNLGNVTGMAALAGKSYSAKLVVFDASHTTGLVWDYIPVSVR